jgi:hypothetical protein
MKSLLYLLGIVNGFDINTDEYLYQAVIDPEVQARVLSATSYTHARKLGGVFGLCADGINIPLKGGLVCDPPNALPQICTLVCQQGYYSSGLNRDIACADAMCEGSCKVNRHECVGNQVKFASRPCSYIRYINCTENESQLCLETVEEECKYSYYEEVRRPCCNITQVGEPEGCWTSGCTGNCDSPGVFHYYSSSCGDVCPPWQDPPNPSFQCSACRVPTEFPPHVGILSSNAKGFDPPSEITLGCYVGYWGPKQTSYCMSTDGSFYPPVDIQCNPCSAPPEIDAELVVRIMQTLERVEFRCIDGYIGDSTFSECHKETGVWSSVEPPYCEVAPSARATPSITPSASITPDPNPSVSPTPSEAPTETPTPTPSASKSPRPPKVKGSRAPTQPPKLRVK